MIKLIKKEVLETFTTEKFIIMIGKKKIEVETFFDDGQWDWSIVGGNSELTEKQYDELIEFMTEYQQ